MPAASRIVCSPLRFWRGCETAIGGAEARAETLVRGNPSRQATKSFCAFKSFRLGHDRREVIAVFALRHRVREAGELHERNKSAAKGRLLRAADLEAGALLDRLHVGAGFVEAAARACVQPRESAAQAIYPQRASPQIRHVQ